MTQESEFMILTPPKQRCTGNPASESIRPGFTQGSTYESVSLHLPCRYTCYGLIGRD